MRLNPVDIIKKKRDGFSLTEEEINFFISAFLLKEITDYQMSALLMAIYFRGLNDTEILAFVNTYINSGEKIDLSVFNKPKADKHSTGGVGDKTSIILAPLLACFDIIIPMMSGRGLGHTGGTLDKLESIPGFRTNLSKNEFLNILKEINVSMIGQTDSLTPADKYIYALRDVTATVENIGLITASITSKKIAEGAECIVYDVKTGSGSTLPDFNKSRELAHKLINVTKTFNRKVIAFLTEMNEPLGKSIGNWLEIEECLEIMDPENKPSELSNDLIELTLTLAGGMLYLCGVSHDLEDGYSLADKKLATGEPLKKFIELTRLQNGDISYLIAPNKYTKAKFSRQIKADKDGCIIKMDALDFGNASVELGCGRKTMQDKINYSAGILLNKKCGDNITKGEIICTLYSDRESSLDNASHILKNAILISDTNSFVKKSKIIEVVD